MAAEYMIKIDQGATWDMQVSIDLNSADYDISNCDFYGTVRQGDTYQEMRVQKISNGGGIVKFSLTDSQTDLLRAGDNRYDIEMHTNNLEAQVFRLMQGRAVVSKTQTPQRP